MSVSELDMLHPQGLAGQSTRHSLGVGVLTSRLFFVAFRSERHAVQCAGSRCHRLGALGVGGAMHPCVSPIPACPCPCRHVVRMGPTRMRYTGTVPQHLG